MLPEGLTLKKMSGCGDNRMLQFGQITLFLSCDRENGHDGYHGAGVNQSETARWEIRWVD